MANIIKIKRGLSSDLSKANLQEGEIAFTTDTKKLYVSTTAAPINENTTYKLTKSGSTITLTGSDGTTTSVTDSNTTYTHPTSAGNKHIPSGGEAGQILRWSAAGTAVWGADNNTTYSNASTSVAGLMSASDKTKLDGIASGATKNTASSTTPKANGTAAVGSESNYARGDHVHPAQTTITGNAGTATTLATARTIAIGEGATGTATSFNGSKNITIPITSMREAYMNWGGKARTGGITPTDAGCSDIHSANKFQFAKPAGITIQYSRDGGATWTNYDTTDQAKIQLVSNIGSAYYIGGRSTNTTVQDQLRITLNATNMGLYTSLQKLLINISTNYSTGASVMVERAMKGSTSTYTVMGTYSISGWSGWNSIPIGYAFGGGATQTGNIDNIRLTFSITGINTAQTSNALVILDIIAIGMTNWSNPSTMARIGHLYSFDYAQNATFPAKVTATSFAGDGASLTNLSASNIASGTLSADRLATSGVTAGSYGPTANVTGTNGTTINVPQITVDSKGRVTSVVNRVYTSKDTDTNTTYTHPTTSGNKHIPSGGSSGQILRWSADGTAVWGADNNTTYSAATTSANGLMTSAMVTKLNGIAAGAQVNNVVVSTSTPTASTAQVWINPSATSEITDVQNLVTNLQTQIATLQNTVTKLSRRDLVYLWWDSGSTADNYSFNFAAGGDNRISWNKSHVIGSGLYVSDTLGTIVVGGSNVKTVRVSGQFECVVSHLMQFKIVHLRGSEVLKTHYSCIQSGNTGMNHVSISDGLCMDCQSGDVIRVEFYSANTANGTTIRNRRHVFAEVIEYYD